MVQKKKMAVVTLASKIELGSSRGRSDGAEEEDNDGEDDDSREDEGDYGSDKGNGNGNDGGGSSKEEEEEKEKRKKAEPPPLFLTSPETTVPTSFQRLDPTLPGHRERLLCHLPPPPPQFLSSSPSLAHPSVRIWDNPTMPSSPMPRPPPLLIDMIEIARVMRLRSMAKDLAGTIKEIPTPVSSLAAPSTAKAPRTCNMRSPTETSRYLLHPLH